MVVAVEKYINMEIKKMKIIKLLLITVALVTASYTFAYGQAFQVCCAEGTSARDCCESNHYAWCSDTQVCAEDSYFCDYACAEYERAYQCMCANTTITVSSSKATDQPYCCSSSDANLQSCCQHLGFTWIGPTANTGKCSAPDPEVCIKYIYRGASGGYS